MEKSQYKHGVGVSPSESFPPSMSLRQHSTIKGAGGFVELYEVRAKHTRLGVHERLASIREQ